MESTYTVKLKTGEITSLHFIDPESNKEYNISVGDQYPGPSGYPRFEVFSMYINFCLMITVQDIQTNRINSYSIPTFIERIIVGKFTF